MWKLLIWWYAFGEHKKLSRSANSTLSSTEWGQDIKTMPNKTSKRLFGTKTKWKNSPLAIPNNFTIFAYEYHHIFSISTPPSISDKIGGSSFTPNIPTKKISENFSIATILPRWLFFVFLVRKIMTLSKWLFSISLVRKIMGMKGLCRYPNRGGVSLFVCSLYSKQAFSCIRLLPESSGTPQGQKCGTSLLSGPWVLHSLSLSTPWVLRRSTRAKVYRIREKVAKTSQK